MEIETALVWGPPTGAENDFEIGWVAQRTLEAGAVLTPPSVRPPLLVSAGRSVALVWQSGSVQVRVPGRAAGSGRLGEEVRVRTETGKRLSGVVVAPGVVDVTPTSARNAGGGG